MSDTLTTVADCLAASRYAHAQFQGASGQIDRVGTITIPADYVAAENAIKRAMAYRLKAEHLDPSQTDPAWQADRDANRGISHTEMMQFFREYLA